MVDPLFSFGGIASGLDTNSIIDQLMAIERQPIVRFQSQQDRMRRVDDAWSAVVGKLSAFRSAVDDAPGRSAAGPSSPPRTRPRCG